MFKQKKDIVPWGNGYALVDTSYQPETESYEIIIVKCSKHGRISNKSWEIPYLIISNIKTEKEAERIHNNCIESLRSEEARRFVNDNFET